MMPTRHRIPAVSLLVASVAGCIPTATAFAADPTPLPRHNERKLSIDTSRYPLRELVTDALAKGGGSIMNNNASVDVTDLEKLHLFEPEDFLAQASIRGNASSRSPFRRVELLRRALHAKWKSSRERKVWETEYLPGIVRDVVGKDERFANETKLIYQRAPMLRFHVAWPLLTDDDNAILEEYDGDMPPNNGRNPGTLAGVHTDADYHHPPGEINFFLPVTQTYGTNSLYVEGALDRGDFAPFELDYGDMMLWNGNNHRHCSPRNISNCTRVSFDFRVIPGSVWDEDGPHCDPESSFKLGTYYMDALADSNR